MSAPLTAGFAEPVGDAQRCFRAVLDAMSRPGRVHDVDLLLPPSPLCAAAAAVLLTLADQETPLWLDPGAASARDWIAFHCGAPAEGDPARAAFAFAIGLPDLTRFSPGTHEAPETSATVIVQLSALSGGRRYRLSGPGLRGYAEMAPVGLPASFAADWRRNRALCPGGIDVILCAGGAMTALPRTVLIEEV